MRKIILATLALTSLSLASWPVLVECTTPDRKIVLEHAELKLTPAALTFNPKGELYVAYREGSDKQPSGIWFRVFDPDSGKQLRSKGLPTARVPLPNGANQFALSPDDSLLLYAQFYGGTLISILDAATLRTVTETSNLPEGVEKHYPKVIGISADDGSVLVAAGITNHLNGVDERLVRLDAHDLARVLSDTTIANPIPEGSFVFGVDNGQSFWIIKAYLLYNYDPEQKKAALKLSDPMDGFSHAAVFLKDRSMILWSDRNEFGYLYQYREGAATIDRRQRIENSGVVRVFVSPDQLYGVALCEHQNLNEWHFGAVTSRTAVVFDAKTLKIIAEIPIAKDLYPELAIWHGNGKIVLATQASSNKLAIYELVDLAQDSKPVTVGPKDGSR